MKTSPLAAVAVAAAVAALASGCFTVHQTPYPEVAMTAAPEGREVRVALAGFEAIVTSFVPVRTYSTVWADGGFRDRRGHWHYGGYYPATVASTTYVPQASHTSAFAARAAELVETSGFTLAATNADYTVEVRFSGPYVTDGDRTRELLCLVGSLLTADYAAQTWTAKLTVRDGATGRMLLHRDYSERHSAAVWGPLPILSPAGSDRTDAATLQVWCLTALTDRALADATAFLATLPPSP